MIYTDNTKYLKITGALKNNNKNGKRKKSTVFCSLRGKAKNFYPHIISNLIRKFANRWCWMRCAKIQGKRTPSDRHSVVCCPAASVQVHCLDCKFMPGPQYS